MENDNITKYIFKVVLIGDTHTGKSSIIRRFTSNQFDTTHNPTIGVDFASKIIKLDETYIRLQLWDTAGQESFRSITRSFYRGSAACVLVYDITNKQSFNNIPIWLEDLRENTTNERIKIILVGTKNDLKYNREVSYDEGNKFAIDNNILFAETSSVNKIEDVFIKICQQIYDDLENTIPCYANGIRLAKVVNPKPKKYCCHMN